jgi:hypothetical protein
MIRRPSKCNYQPAEISNSIATYLDTVSQIVDRRLYCTDGGCFIVQQSMTIRVGALCDPTRLSLKPIRQAGIEDGVTQGPRVHLHDDLVLELAPGVVVEAPAARRAHGRAADDEGRMVKARAQLLAPRAVQLDEVEKGLGVEAAERRAVLGCVDGELQRLGRSKLGFFHPAKLARDGVQT